MHIGIDVASRTLVAVVHETQRCWEVPNTPAGIARLQAVLAQAAPGASVVLEATNHWDLEVAWTLAATGHPVRRLNPKQARDAARAWGVRTKTDRVDARVLAQIAHVYAGRPVPPLPAQRQQALRELRALRQALVEERKHYKQRLHSVTSALVRTSYEAQIARLTTAIAETDAALATAVASDAALQAELALLQGVPGFGRITALTLLLQVPDLATSDPKQLASLLGVAPHAQDSGLHHGRRRCQGGKADLRHALWMAAVSARRCNPALRTFADRLAAAGKPPKVVLTAVLRKLLHLAHALLRDRRPWTDRTGAA